MRSLDEDIAAAHAYHRHLCAGMVLGVRMARCGVRLLGIEDPHTYRDLVVFVEANRCAADAVYAVTGITLGRRRLKPVDYGRMAMTFVDLATGKAVRVAARDDVPRVTHGMDPIAFFAGYEDERILTVQNVRVDIPPDDLPGAPSNSAVCECCGERVVNGRAVVSEGRTLCRPCAEGNAYYTVID